MDFNYDPRCGVYLNGHYYYISYYLPNKSRICRSLGTTKKVIAKKKMHLKEQELYQGVFDDHDISECLSISKSKVRLDLETAFFCINDSINKTSKPCIKVTVGKT